MKLIGFECSNTLWNWKLVQVLCKYFKFLVFENLNNQVIKKMIADLWGEVGFIGDNTTNIATIEEIQIQKIDKI